ncbi:unnamed protein product [Diamesa serratosioi]
MGVNSKSEVVCGNQCQCNSNYKKDKVPSDNLFAPIKNKMKVLKKIKKRMGLASRTPTSCPGPNNLPALQFHNIHGDNVRISRDGKVARRYESFCKGIAFSARPVKVNERVCVRFAEISNNWSGVIRFGFTCIDPSTLAGTLPKYACPDLTNKPGFWGKALHERYCQRNVVLFYYVTSSGEVHYGINGEEKGLFITDVDTRGPLWSMIDIYGNSTAVEYLDSRTYMCTNNTSGSLRNSCPPSVARATTPTNQMPQEIYELADRMQTTCLNNDNNEYNTAAAVAIPHIRTLALPSQQENRRATIHSSNNSVNVIAAQANLIAGYQPIHFHPTTGRNLRLSQDRTVASRVENEFCQGYVFTQRPIKYGEQFIIQILKNDSNYGGSLALGLTSCNPNTLQSSDLPDDADILLDRPEYWVVSKNVGQIVSMARGDEIKFSVTMTGEVQISRNDNAPITLMYIDQSLQLWGFFDVYGATQSIRVLSKTIQMPPIYQQPPTLTVQKALTAIVPINHQMSASAQIPINGQSTAVAGMSRSTTSIISGTPSGDIQVQSSGSLVVVNLPPPTQSTEVRKQSALIQGRSLPRLSEANQMSSSIYAVTKKQLTYIDNAAAAVLSYGSIQDNPLGADCTICYENQIDSVLYTCGHMALCYPCAMKHWSGGNGVCPLCRAPIRDVIRTYKS